MKLRAGLLILTLLTSSWLGAQSQTSFEKRMYNIYKSSYDEEVSDAQWAQYVANLSQRSYTISEGDTLWDLSTIFFGDGFFWPKIWSYNSTLTNPHLLSVGQKIEFFSGSMDLPPGVSIEPTGENFDQVAPLSGFVIVEGESVDPKDERIRKSLYPGAPKIPGRKRAIRPVQPIPSSFQNSDSYDASKYDEKGVSMDIRPPVRVNPLFVASSFLYGGLARNYPRIGRLVESEDDVLLVGLNQKVYIRSEEDLKIGERFTVMGRDYEFDRNGFDGDVISYMGTVEIGEKINKTLYRGVIVSSLSGVKGNPWISREEIPTFADDYAGRPSDVAVRIIGGGLENTSRVYGQSDVVYLGGGTNRGLRKGDILGIYKRRDIRYDEPVIDKSPTPIAHIKVFRAEPKLASAFVISSNDVILPGDETGAPTLVRPTTTQSELDDLDSIETGLDFQQPGEGNDLPFEDEDIEFE